LKSLNFQTALDAGCGTGLFSFYLAERFPEAHITGYDLSPEYIIICDQNKISKKIDNLTFKVADLTELDEVENYDFIFSIDVMEHITHNIKVLENIYHALLPGGIFYLAMPYEPGHQHLFPRKYFRKYIAWREKEHIGEQYSPKSITEILSQIGFWVIESRYTFGFWGKLAWELDLLTEGVLIVNRVFKPLLLICSHLDTLWKNGPGSYAIRVIARK
jgi:SAM-dependent methyltransferase